MHAVKAGLSGKPHPLESQPMLEDRVGEVGPVRIASLRLTASTKQLGLQFERDSPSPAARAIARSVRAPTRAPF